MGSAAQPARANRFAPAHLPRLTGAATTWAMSAAPTLDDARDLLKRVYGYEAFRGLQEDVIADALAGRDALAVLPEGVEELYGGV